MAASRALYISSSIGMGHAPKDLAIARELRNAIPDLQVVWLAGHPASQVIGEAGEGLLPANECWNGASAIAERSLHKGHVNLVRYIYSSFPSWIHNARIVNRLLRDENIDVMIGNEAWEVFIPLIVRAMRPRIPFVMIMDFVGVDPMTANPFERIGAWFLNALWSLDSTVFGRGAHSIMFIGEPADVPALPFGLGLPDRRKHSERHYEFIGHVINFRPEEFADQSAWRRRLGYGEEPLVICSAGGTALGRDLLEVCAKAFPFLRRQRPDLRMVLICGPRLDPAGIEAPDGVDVVGYVPRLYEHLACCDVAVVQCGASSTTELAALKRPFVYLPIPGHFEQQLVAARLERYGAGTRMSLADTTPESLASAIERELARTSFWPDLPVDGARQGALHIAGVLGRDVHRP